MIQISNALSDAILAIVCVFSFFHFFARVPFYNRLLWGIFLVTTTLAAAAGVCKFLGMTQIA
ncbi:MAG: hypothetical protein ACK4GN_17940, partial [Runella sp.]